ncbi:MAG: hypothetical protein ABR534_14490, partial [Desulfotignum sp.]
YESRWFILTGLFLAFFCIPFSGLAPNFWVLLLVLCLGSLGSSMFHPATTGMVPLYSGNRTGFCLSIYNTGGTFAFALVRPGSHALDHGSGAGGLCVLPQIPAKAGE